MMERTHLSLLKKIARRRSPGTVDSVYYEHAMQLQELGLLEEGKDGWELTEKGKRKLEQAR